MFYKWTDLESDVHVADAEVDNAYDVCNQIKVAYNTKIASISVDNAASKVAERVSQKLNHGGQDDSILSAKLIRIAPETSSF